MIEAVLWDNDGVLVDSEIVFFEVTRRAFLLLGIALNRELWGRRFLAEGKRSLDIAVALGAEPVRAQAVLDERNQEYVRILQQPPPLRPRVRETLAAMSGRVRLAIVTGSPRAQLHQMLGETGWLDRFEVIVTGDDSPHAKPHPGLYLAALQALGLPAAHCLAIEDSPRGLAAARAAGIACVVVPTELTQTLDFPGALSIETDVSGVLKHLELTAGAG